MRSQRHGAGFVCLHFNVNRQISPWNLASRFLGPFGQFQTRAGKDVPETGIFPFARVTEAVEIEMPDVPDVERNRLRREFIGFHHRERRTFDAPLHTQCPQQVSHKRGFARTQVAMQFNESVVHRRLGGQRCRKQLGCGLILPDQTFYNGCASLHTMHTRTHVNSSQLVFQIRDWARELGFSQIGVTGVDLSSAEAGLQQWLSRGFHGDMAYMATHGLKRARPAELVPGTVSVITARMDYLPSRTPSHWQAVEFDRLKRPAEGIVSVYARGRDYHKVLRNRLQKLSERIAADVGPFGHRVFTDSAPVLEAELAARSGQGWRGKHTLLLSREAGSMFFLGEIYVDIALPQSEPVTEHCGSCSACIDVCPTQAILSPHQLDARRCISYLTIEHAGSIPVELRPLMGNRIYGCDDCQLVCPWNKFAQRSALPDFDEREGLTGQQLVTLLGWREDEFLRYTEGSPIRRIGHQRWLRNVAVAMGNALRTGAPSTFKDSIRQSLAERLDDASPLVQEHILWALAA